MKIVCPYLCFHVPISSKSFENPTEINEIALLTTLRISSFFVPIYNNKVRFCKMQIQSNKYVKDL